MADILETIKEHLPRGSIKDTIFEGANIVVYTTDTAFLRNVRRFICSSPYSIVDLI